MILTPSPDVQWRNKATRFYSTDSSGNVEYKFDEYGYRIGNSTGSYKLLVVGCSYTFGTGIRFEDTYPYVLCGRITSHFMVHNLSVVSASNDYICRALLSNFNQIQPDLCVLYFTYPNRREYLAEDFVKIHAGQEYSNKNHARIRDCFYMTENEPSSIENMRKNALLSYWFLKNRKTRFLIGSVRGNLGYDFMFDFTLKVDQEAEDKKHPGCSSHLLFAERLHKKFLE